MMQKTDHEILSKRRFSLSTELPAGTHKLQHAHRIEILNFFRSNLNINKIRLNVAFE